MSAMITTQKIFLKLGKIGPNTLKVVSTPTITTETNLAHLDFSSHSMSTNNRIKNRLPSQPYNPVY